VQDQSGKRYTMDHYATRYPTNVLDIASFLVRLSGTFLFSSDCPFVDAQALCRSEQGSTTANHTLLCSRTIYEMYVYCPSLFSPSLTGAQTKCASFSPKFYHCHTNTSFRMQRHPQVQEPPHVRGTVSCIRERRRTCSPTVT
jgi:hypothetical protein